MSNEEVIAAISNMRIEFMQDSKSKNDAVNTKLDEIKTSLEGRLEAQEERIGDLEAKVLEQEEKIHDLTVRGAEDHDRLLKLTERQINFEAHQRRLNLKITGIAYEEKEDVSGKVRDFLKIQLGIDASSVDKFIFRDAHRLGENRSGLKPIIIAFIDQAHRNLVFSRAYKLKGTDFVIKVDLPMELASVQSELLLVRKEIRKVNQTALAALTYRSYKPVLLVKFQGKVQSYNHQMKLTDLEMGDTRARPT